MTQRKRLGLGALLLLSTLALVAWPAIDYFKRESFRSTLRDLSHPDAQVSAAARDKLDLVGTDAIPELITALKDSDPAVRAGSAWTLERLGPQARPAIPALIAALGEPDIHWQNSKALAAIGEAAIPPLNEALGQGNEHVREGVCKTLVVMGKPAVPALISALKDKNAVVRTHAASALFKLRNTAAPATDALIDALKDENPLVRRHAALALHRIRPDEVLLALGGLADAVDGSDRTAQRAPSIVLKRRIRAALITAIPDLIGALEEQDLDSRREAVRSLGWLGFKAHTAAPALLKLYLQEKDWDARPNARFALTQIGRSAASSIAAVLNNQNMEVRRDLVHALVEIGIRSDPAIPALIDALKDQDIVVRSRAATALRVIGPKAKKAAPALIAALEDHEPTVRFQAAYALSSVGEGGSNRHVDVILEALQHDGAILDFLPHGGPVSALNRLRPADLNQPKVVAAVPILIKHGADSTINKLGRSAIPGLLDALKAKDISVRIHVATLLAKVGEAKAAVPALVDPLKTQDLSERLTLVAALGDLGAEADAAVPILIELLKKEELIGFGEPIKALGKIGPGAKDAVPTLLATSKHKTSYVRYYAFVALGGIRIHTPEVLAVLVAGLGDPEDFQDGVFGPNVSVQSGALDALVQIGKPTVPALAGALTHPNKAIRSGAAVALGKIGPEAKVSSLALQRSLKDEDAEVRVSAAGALVRIDRTTIPTVMPVLLETLKEKDWRLRCGTVSLLGELGEEGVNAIPALEALLKEKQTMPYEVERCVLQSLRKIGKAAVPALADALRHDDMLIRSWAAEELGRLGIEARAAVPMLASAMNDKNDKSDLVNSSVAQALGEIGPDAKAAVPALAQYLKRKDRHYRLWAAKALGKVGAADAHETLLAALQDTDLGVLCEAAKALSLARYNPSKTIPILVGLLEHESVGVRLTAIKSLGRFGPDAKACTSALLEALDDPAEGVSAAAAEALRRVDPQKAEKSALKE